MKLIPILFSTPMVQAILEGRKTMTRRIIKPRYSNTTIEWKELHSGRDRILVEMQNDAPPSVKNEDGTTTYTLRAYKEVKEKYKVGDVLWVRESFQYDWKYITEENDKFYFYKADGDKKDVLLSGEKWKPSIHMPYTACRIWLKITHVRLERLQDITEADSKCEGVEYKDFTGGRFYRSYNEEDDLIFTEVFDETSARDSFCDLWLKINGEKSWLENEFVWVVQFEKINKP